MLFLLTIAAIFGFLLPAVVLLVLRLLSPNLWINFVNRFRDISFKQYWTTQGFSWRADTTTSGSVTTVQVRVEAHKIIEPVRIRTTCSIPTKEIEAEMWRDAGEGHAFFRGRSQRRFRDVVEVSFYQPPLAQGETLGVVLKAPKPFTVTHVERARSFFE